ncbi:MAG: PD40 domain-containing protein, partial [Actinobacteria bacterium]|nr:PD40 domain-containing protein [Actinomycetota bacterium]
MKKIALYSVIFILPALLFFITACGIQQFVKNAIINTVPETTVAEEKKITTGGMIAFSSDRDGNKEIYIMNSDGSGLVRLTNNDSSDSLYAWSPDGSKIAFSSDRDGNKEIYIMNSDGSGLVRLTN